MEVLDESAHIDKLATEAKETIDAAIEKAESNISLLSDCQKDQFDDGPDSTPNIRWLTIREFTIENGKKKIEDFLQTWERGSHWLHYTEFLSEDICKNSKRYRYKVQWSIPTRRKPIPRATASVYFTIELSTVKPKDYPVKVYYIFEANKLVHRPGKSKFREQWLKDIVDSKILLMESVNF